MKRAVTRVTTAALTGLVTTLLTAGPAFASDPVGTHEGADPGKGLGPAGTLLLFVVTPAAACIVLGMIVWLPGALRAHRYRPAEGWGADAIWFAGPVDVQQAIAGAQRGDVMRGGAHGSW